ncbi:hypothetical protein ACFC1R_24210 [Kitasatospora sp. NPDC056138]|uniref:hypothetical protein n=1 Tax=Kitasatospora sp. NPDC056138 TaxID=3345724 RepID=UPI0035D7DDFB
MELLGPQGQHATALGCSSALAAGGTGAAEEFSNAEDEPTLYGNNGRGFEFTSRKSGDVFAGPLASIIAVQRKGQEPTAEGSLQRLAAMLRGEVDGHAVHFTHAGRLFRLQFGPKGWVCSSRDGGAYSSDYSLRENDRPDEIANQVMGDLKAEFGRGH